MWLPLSFPATASPFSTAMKRRIMAQLHIQTHTHFKIRIHTQLHSDNIVIVLRLPNERHAPNAANCICILVPKATASKSHDQG